jgi:hypothetical protein
MSGQFPAKHEKALAKPFKQLETPRVELMIASVRRCTQKQVIKLLIQQYLHENLFHGVEELKIGDRNGWKDWWTWSGSNRRPLPCHGVAIPAGD